MKIFFRVRYSRSIIPFFLLSIFVTFLLLYFANITRKIEKDNEDLEKKISLIKEKINVNELEFSLFISYEYLIKIQKIYFEKIENNNFDNRISYNYFEKKVFQDLHNISMRKLGD